MEWKSIWKKDVLGLLAIITLCLMIGLIPSWTSLYPTGIGDTSHHAALTYWIQRNDRLPSSHSEYYPLVPRGLFAQSMPYYPAGMHIIITLTANAFNQTILQFISPLNVLVSSLIAGTVYTLASRKGIPITLSILTGILAFFSGPLALAIVAGSLSTVWGLFFLFSTILGIVEYEAKPEKRKLIFFTLSIIGLTLYYSLYIPLLILILFLSINFRSRFNLFQKFFFTTSLFAISIGISYLFNIIGQLQNYIRYGQLYFIQFNQLSTAIMITLLIILISIVLFFKSFKPIFKKFKPIIQSSHKIILLVLTTFALYGYFKIAWPGLSKGMIFTDYLIIRRFWVPGYEYEIIFGAALIIILSSILLIPFFKFRSLMISLIAVFIFVDYFYYSTDSIYAYSKFIFIIPLLSLSFLPYLINTLRNMTRSKSYKYKIVPSIFLILLAFIIAINIGVGINTLRQTSIAITPNEEKALLQMRDNYVKIFVRDDYRFYVSADVNKAVWYEAVTEHSFNSSFPEGYIFPPFPISYNLSYWHKMARPGSIVVFNSIYEDSMVAFLEKQPPGTKILLDENYEIIKVYQPEENPQAVIIYLNEIYIEVIEVYPPLVFVKKIA